MFGRDYRDIAGGLLLVLAGAGIAWHAGNTLSLGTVQRMGAGLFPLSIGVILAGFGVVIMVPALFRRGDFETVEWRSAFSVLASVVAFTVTIQPFGLIPATIALIVVSNIAEDRFRPVVVGAMCVLLPASGYLIFSLGLGLALPMLRWPF